ncbi:MAG TPA: GGDEF domain-containing protein [Pseudobacteroides sp.]|uniref:GGDEF domain-containing protein n=1 Tax=Pseudobacteroides sp. TaxID=1968840 RepID=UPI002F937303
MLLLALSLITRVYELDFSYGVRFTFGNLFIVIILRYFGLIKAFSVAVIANALEMYFFKGNFYTIFFTLEILFLGILWRNKKRNLFYIDIIYWSLIGVPLSAIVFYINNSSIGVEGFLLIANNCINGFLNVLAADIIISYLPIQIILGHKEKKLADLNRLMFHLAMAAVLGPFLVYIMVDGWVTQERLNSEIHQILNKSTTNIMDQVKNWDTNDLRKIRLRSPIHIKRFEEIIKNNPFNEKVDVLVVDKNHNIYAANKAAEKYGGTYNWKDGGNDISVSENIYMWMPESKELAFNIKQWSQSFYIMVSSFENMDLHIQVIVSLSNYADSVWQNYLNKFEILLLFCIIAIVISLMMGRILSRDLSKLTISTTGLPDKLKRHEMIEWPDTSTVQVNTLVSNFQVMSDNLVNLFTDINIMNDKLLSQTIELENSREEMKRLAYNDTLTGLPNRYYFTKYLEGLLCDADVKNIAVMFIDLNRFKQINDNLGHDIGDMLLNEIAQRLKYFLKDDSFVARLGGDEFVVILNDTDRTEASMAAMHINKTLCEEVVIHQNGQIHSLYVSGSIGISLYPSDAKDKTTLLKKADLAMYSAKETGGNTYKFYSDMEKASVAQKLENIYKV